MKILRFGDQGRERPGVLVGDDTIVDLSDLVDDFGPDSNWDVLLERIRTLVDDPRAIPRRIPVQNERIGPPLSRFGKIVCAGLNYRAHADEVGAPIPEEPVLFMKAPDTVIGPNDEVQLPPQSKKSDYEVELAIVIARRAWKLDEPSESMSHVLGYMISNDLSERTFQMEHGGQWMKGKNCPTFNPTGPWIATTDSVADPQKLELRCAVNGEVRQLSNTSDMIFSVEYLVWYISQFMALNPGDVINTGTPQGIGMTQSPPSFLEVGDRIDLTITGLGAQTQFVVAGERSHR